MRSERATADVISIYPALGWTAIAPGPGAIAGSVLEHRRFLPTSSGRSAIALALRASGAGPGTEVLLPAYYCKAMTAPIEAVGARPIHYPLPPDLGVDCGLLAERVTARTRAVIAVHYFGRAADLRELRALCDARGIVLIEDCAHAFYTHDGHGAVGGAGHFAVCSLTKFLPCHDGGALVTGEGMRAPGPLHPIGLGAELRAWSNVIERSRLRIARGLVRGSLVVFRALKRGRSPALQGPTVPSAVDGGTELDVRAIDLRASSTASVLLRRGRGEEIRTLRRRRYAELLEGIRGVPGVEPLMGELPDGAVPYVFPLLAAGGDRVFTALRRQGVQVFRWEYTESQPCATSRHYARRLLQLPCHQTLTAENVRRLREAVRRAAAE